MRPTKAVAIEKGRAMIMRKIWYRPHPPMCSRILEWYNAVKVISEPEQVLINSTYVVEVLDDLFSLISFIIIPHLDLGLHWRRLLGQLNLFCRQFCL